MRFILPFIACLLLQIATANSQTKIGVMLTLEDADDVLSIRPGFGLVLDHRFTKKTESRLDFFIGRFVLQVLY
jgi:hypothetical protein